MLWNVKVPSKIRNFAWRLTNHSLPSADVLHSRHMSVPSRCSICNAMEDTWRHSLMDCTMAKCVWALADEEVTEHMISNQDCDPKGVAVFHDGDTGS
jgi:hypothetical protein